jgi:hypothetical protein
MSADNTRSSRSIIIFNNLVFVKVLSRRNPCIYWCSVTVRAVGGSIVACLNISRDFAPRHRSSRRSSPGASCAPAPPRFALRPENILDRRGYLEDRGVGRISPGILPSGQGRYPRLSRSAEKQNLKNYEKNEKTKKRKIRKSSHAVCH